MNLPLLCVFFLFLGGEFSIFQARYNDYISVEEYELGGTAAKHSRPWFALLHREGSPVHTKYLCGGTLISSRHVVSAAHCFKKVDYPLAVTFNVFNRCAPKEENRLQIAVERVVNHPLYGEAYYNDIALVILQKPVHGLKAAALPQPVYPPSSVESSQDDTWWEPAEVGRRALVAGFGLTTSYPEKKSPCILQEAKMRVLSSTKCDLSELPEEIAATMLCAGKHSGGVDICRGDSGGGLLIREDDELTLIGVVSRGYGCGAPGYPAIFTRVAYFVPWLLEEMAEGNDISGIRNENLRKSTREEWTLSNMINVLNDFFQRRIARTISDIIHDVV